MNNPKDQYEAIEETPFNMAVLFYIEVNRIIAKKNDAYVEGDLGRWYRSLKVLYGMVRFRIKQDYSKEFIKAKMILQSDARGSLRNQMQSMAASNAEIVLGDIDNKLMLAMDKHHMIFPKIDAKGLESIRQRYRLYDADKQV